MFQHIYTPEDILEEGVMQLNTYCQPANQAIELLHSGIHFTLLTWPGVYMPNKDAQIAKWQEEGVIIAERVELVVRNDEDKKLKEMKGFVDTMNGLIDSSFKNIEI